MEKKKWIVDPCQDAYGHWTIRLDDGTEHGDTESPPIATVYDAQEIAQSIVEQHNAAIDAR